MYRCFVLKDDVLFDYISLYYDERRGYKRGVSINIGFYIYKIEQFNQRLADETVMCNLLA